MISGAVPFGATTPNQLTRFVPDTNSPTAGMYGNAATRVSEVTASAQIFPALMKDS